MKKLILLMGLGAMFLTGCTGASVKEAVKREVTNFAQFQLDNVESCNLITNDGRIYRMAPGEKPTVEYMGEIMIVDKYYLKQRSVDLFIQYQLQK